MDYNRYIGNTGRVYRMPGGESGREQKKPEQKRPERHRPEQKRPEQRRNEPVGGRGRRGPDVPQTVKNPPGPLDGLKSGLGGLLSKAGGLELETEDLMLMLVLYLMYRESGDTELLIILGAMLFL